MSSNVSKRLLQFLLLAVCLASEGCLYPYRFEASPPRAAAALGAVHDGYAEVRLFYATDRNRTGASAPALFYGWDRSTTLKVGEAEVTIPPEHGLGRLETASPFIQGKPQRHVLLTRVDEPLETAPFMADLRQQIELSARKELLLYIHGFACTFEEAARRGAQIAHDIDFDGPVVIYSWSSQGWLLGYLADAENVGWTQPYLVSFLKLLSDQAGAEHIHILAHSMGTSALIPAVKELVRQRTNPRGPEFDQVVLAAGDMDTALFKRDYAPFLVQAAQRITVYVSAADWALGSSRRLHYYARLGQPGDATTLPADFPCICIVDATRQDKGLYGHVYYGSSPRMLADLRGVLSADPPEARALDCTGGIFCVP